MTTPAPLSYSHGTSPQPLLGETIGANLRRTAAALGDREALVYVPSGRRWTYSELDADIDTLARGLIAAGIKAGDRVGIWSPNCPEWVLSSTPPPGRAPSWSTSTRPTAATSWTTPCASPASGCWSARTFKTSDYRAMVDEVRGDLPDLHGWSTWARPAWDELFVAGAEPVRGDDQLAERGGRAGLRRPDQHPVHLRHDRVPQGRHPLPSQHPQQRLLHRRGLPLHRGRPGLHPGAVLPLLRHGDGQPRLHHARGLRSSSRPRASTPPPPSPRWQAERCTSLYGVPTMFIAELALTDFAGYDLSSLRTGIMAGLPVPGGGHEAGGQRDAHDRGRSATA